MTTTFVLSKKMLLRVVLAAALLAVHACTYEKKSSSTARPAAASCLHCESAVVGTCARGEWVDVSKGGSLLFRLSPIEGEQQHLWEAFPSHYMHGSKHRGTIEERDIAQAGETPIATAGLTKPTGGSCLLAHHFMRECDDGLSTTARHPVDIAVRLRGGGRPKNYLGGKPLPGRGYMGNVIPRSGRDPFAQAEREMIAQAAKHRRKSTKKRKDPEGWLKKFLRQKQGLIDPKKEKPMVDTSKPKPRPSSIARRSYKHIFGIEPQPRPPKMGVLKKMVATPTADAAGAGAASVISNATANVTAARRPTQQVLSAILKKVKIWQSSQATKYLEDDSIEVELNPKP
jgi:hypothetical protein